MNNRRIYLGFFEPADYHALWMMAVCSAMSVRGLRLERSQYTKAQGRHAYLILDTEQLQLARAA